MAGDEFQTAAPDKQYLRVYPLNMKELDIYAGNTEPPADGSLPPLPETGKEQYFVMNKDGTGEIIAADPAEMAGEFQGNIADLSVNALEGRFQALQAMFAENTHLMSPALEGEFTPSQITSEMMLNSLPNFQSELDRLGSEFLELDGKMIVNDEETQGMMNVNSARQDELNAMISGAEELSPLIEHSYHLINEVEGEPEPEHTLTGDQYDQLHEKVFGVESSQDHPIPAYAKG